MDTVNVTALARMEEFARDVLRLKPEKRDAYFAGLVESGIVTQEESDGLAQYVMLYRMFTDQRYYKAIQNATFEMYMKNLEENESVMKLSADLIKETENAGVPWYMGLFNQRLWQNQEIPK